MGLNIFFLGNLKQLDKLRRSHWNNNFCKSQNVLEGLKYAKENKMKSVALREEIPKRLKITDEIISIPAKNTQGFKKLTFYLVKCYATL